MVTVTSFEKLINFIKQAFPMDIYCYRSLQTEKRQRRPTAIVKRSLAWGSKTLYSHSQSCDLEISAHNLGEAKERNVVIEMCVLKSQKKMNPRLDVGLWAGYFICQNPRIYISKLEMIMVTLYYLGHVCEKAPKIPWFK